MKKVVGRDERDYIAGMKYKDISTKYNIPLNTLKSWMRCYDWQRGSKKKTQLKARGAPIERVHPQMLSKNLKTRRLRKSKNSFVYITYNVSMLPGLTKRLVKLTNERLR